MRNRIEIWTKGKNEENIMTFYDPAFDPFTVGMKFHFNESEMHPKAIEEISKEFNVEFAEKWVKETKEKSDKYRLSKFKIISKYVSVEHDLNFRRSDGDSQQVIITYYVRKCSWGIKWEIRSLYWKLKRLIKK